MTTVNFLFTTSHSRESGRNITNTELADGSTDSSVMLLISRVLNGAFMFGLLLLNPALLANLLAISDTALEANKLIMKKTTTLLGILQILDSVLTYLTMEIGVQTIFISIFNYVSIFLYGMAVIIVINVVAADFIKASSSLDSVLNSQDLIEESEKLVQRYRKIKAGMSPLLFINCICCTVVLATSFFFTILCIRRNDFGNAAKIGIFALYNLMIMKFFTSLSGSCYEELYRNYGRLRSVRKKLINKIPMTNLAFLGIAKEIVQKIAESLLT